MNKNINLKKQLLNRNYFKKHCVYFSTDHNLNLIKSDRIEYVKEQSVLIDQKILELPWWYSG